jgi:hypothetical protein
VVVARLMGSSSSTFGRSRGRDHASREVGARAVHGGHVQDARRPLRHSIEHLAGDVVPDLEVMFGLAMGRIGLWALNENYCPHTAV